MRLIDADKLIDDYAESSGTISDLMELILDAAEEAPPPNDPLTLEDLRKMDGDPVWVVFLRKDYSPCWMLVKCGQQRAFFSQSFSVAFADYGKTWLAYRRNPGEVC